MRLGYVFLVFIVLGLLGVCASAGENVYYIDGYEIRLGEMYSGVLRIAGNWSGYSFYDKDFGLLKHTVVGGVWYVEVEGSDVVYAVKTGDGRGYVEPGEIMVYYSDFDDPGEINDFVIVDGEWRIENGVLNHTGGGGWILIPVDGLGRGVVVESVMLSSDSDWGVGVGNATEGGGESSVSGYMANYHNFDFFSKIRRYDDGNINDLAQLDVLSAYTLYDVVLYVGGENITVVYNNTLDNYAVDTTYDRFTGVILRENGNGGYVERLLVYRGEYMEYSVSEVRIPVKYTVDVKGDGSVVFSVLSPHDYADLDVYVNENVPVEKNFTGDVVVKLPFGSYAYKLTIVFGNRSWTYSGVVENKARYMELDAIVFGIVTLGFVAVFVWRRSIIPYILSLVFLVYYSMTYLDIFSVSIRGVLLAGYLLIGLVIMFKWR